MEHHHRSNSQPSSSSPCCTFCFNRLFIFPFCVSALITTSCMGTERSVWSALRNICEWLFHYSDAHYCRTCVILIVGVVFRKALGDGKRAIILQPDWAKVSAVSQIHHHQFEVTICWELGQTLTDEGPQLCLHPELFRRFSSVFQGHYRFCDALFYLGEHQKALLANHQAQKVCGADMEGVKDLLQQYERFQTELQESKGNGRSFILTSASSDSRSIYLCCFVKQTWRPRRLKQKRFLLKQGLCLLIVLLLCYCIMSERLKLVSVMQSACGQRFFRSASEVHSSAWSDVSFLQPGEFGEILRTLSH